VKIAIIGSSQYKDRFLQHELELKEQGHHVRSPVLDSHPDFDELMVCFHNKELIQWADEVHLIWDRRSVGTIFDFGMVFMAEKPLKIIYFEPKTFEGVMQKYERLSL